MRTKKSRSYLFPKTVDDMGPPRVVRSNRGLGGYVRLVSGKLVTKSQLGKPVAFETGRSWTVWIQNPTTILTTEPTRRTTVWGRYTNLVVPERRVFWSRQMVFPEGSPFYPVHEIEYEREDPVASGSFIYTFRFSSIPVTSPWRLRKPTEPLREIPVVGRRLG